MFYVNRFVLVPVEEHLDSRINQERTEYEQQPVEPLNEGARREDENKPQHYRPEDAIKQHPMIILFRHSERQENHNHHKDIVDGKRQFNQIAGDVFQRKLSFVMLDILVPRKGVVIRHLMVIQLILRHKLLLVMHIHHHVTLQTQEHEKQQRQRHPNGSPSGRLFERHHMILLVQDSQIQKQKEGDYYYKNQKE